MLLCKSSLRDSPSLTFCWRLMMVVWGDEMMDEDSLAEVAELDRFFGLLDAGGLA